MKTILFTSLFLCFSALSYSQVGIGTNTPSNSAMLEITASDKGVLFPRMSSTQRAAIASPAAGLYVFDTNTNSLWVYNGTLWVNTVAEAIYGDVKSGFQAADHSGWIKLDGRAVSGLTTTQKAAAAALGFASTLPNASSAYLSQNGTSMGSLSGSNTTSIAQANLPNVSFSGTAQNNGNHGHWVDPGGFWSTTNGDHGHGSNATGGPNGYGLVYANGNSTLGGSDYTWGEPNGYVTPGALSIYNNGNHAHWIDVPGLWSSENGDHGHNVTVSTGGSGTPLTTSPKSLSVNMFIYLGL